MSKKRKKAKKASKIKKNKRFYDVSTQNKQYWKPAGSGSVSADNSVQRAGDQLRAIARSLDENHDLATGTLDVLVKKTIGTELQLIPVVRTTNGKPLEKLNRDLERLWLDYSRFPEVTRELSMAEVQRLVCRSWLRDGEMLAQHVRGMGSIRPKTDVAYALELLEADFLPFYADYEQQNQGTANIVAGVEKNQWGQPVAYWLYREHPGSINTNTYALRTSTKRVTADDIIHLKLTKRLRQTRGVSIFAPVLRRFEDCKDYEESERIAARLNASMGAAITKSTEFAQTTDDSAGNRVMQMEAGAIFDDLLPGENISMIGAERPNPELVNFRNSQLRAIAAGTGTAYSAISQNYDGSYSSMRQELQDSKVNYEILRTQFINDFLNPVFNAFVEVAQAQGLIRIPQSVDMNTLRCPQWSIPATPWIDPKRETEADILLIDNEIVSRSTIQRKMGLDPKAQQMEIDIEPKVEKDTPATGAQDEPPAENTDDEEAA